MWVILGEPAFSVAVPCWVKAGTIADPLLGKKHSPLCSSAIALRKACYDEDAKKLQTAKLKDIWAETWKLEDAIFAETEQRLAKWRETMPATRRIATFHESTSKRAYRMIQRLEEKYTPATAPAPRSRD
jgi:hypothetical protein